TIYRALFARQSLTLGTKRSTRQPNHVRRIFRALCRGGTFYLERSRSVVRPSFFPRHSRPRHTLNRRPCHSQHVVIPRALFALGICCFPYPPHGEARFVFVESVGAR